MPDKINVLNSVIKIGGKVYDTDGRRRIDLKRPIRDLFEPMESETNKARFQIELCLSQKALFDRSLELLSQGVMPLLIYFERGDSKC